MHLFMLQAQILFKAGYGSSKDIYVYKELGLSPQQTYIVGKSSKKQMSQAQVFTIRNFINLV